MNILSEKKNCKTILDDHNNVIKHYYDKLSYETEKNFYEKMNGKQYIPKLIAIADMKITIEYLGDNSLKKYLKNHSIPIDLAQQFYDIEIDMLNCGFYSPGEHGLGGKFTHAFVDETIKPFESGYIKIIDFDVIEDNITPQAVDVFKESINEKYAFLFNKNDKSLDELSQKLLMQGVEKKDIDAFIKQFK